MTAAKPDAITTWAKHMALLRALKQAQSALTEARVPVLAVKGVVLAHELYDDVAHRPIADVDLRVRPRDFVRAVRALRAQRWKADYTSKQLGAISFLPRGALVELESTVGPPGLCGLTVAQMMGRSVERRLPGDVVVREPDIVDHAVLLVVNAFKDKLFDCPPWSRDDLEALARHPRFDPTTFLSRVREARVVTLTWIVADWLAREHASDSWRVLRDSLGARPPSEWYAQLMLRMARSRPHSFATRILARAGSDLAHRRVAAIAATVAGTVSSSLATRVDPPA